MRLEENMYGFWEQARTVTLELLVVIFRRGGLIIASRFHWHLSSRLTPADTVHRMQQDLWTVGTLHWVSDEKHLSSQVRHPWPFCALVPFNPHPAGLWIHGMDYLLPIILFSDLGSCLMVEFSLYFLVNLLKAFYIQENNLIHLGNSVWWHVLFLYCAL